MATSDPASRSLVAGRGRSGDASNEMTRRIHHALIVLLLLLSGSSPIASGFRIPEFFNSSSFPGAPNDWRGESGGVWDGFKSLLDAHRGQTNCSNLPQLKQFLQQFGYSPALSSSNGPGEFFDSDTESAVKLYQSNFGLNATGVLDEKTLKQMIRPRCGREDAIDGVSLMKRSRKEPPGKPAGRDHEHKFVQHYSFFPNSPKWDSKQELTYAIASDSSDKTGISQSQLELIFSEAFGEWAAVVPINFTQIRQFSRADIRIGFASGEHGDGKPFDGVLGVLAHAFSPEDGRLHFDASESWVVDGSRSRSGVDLRSVAVHEIGHILGLGHSAEESAVMFPNIGAGEIKVSLSRDDVSGAQELYGANPNYNADEQSEARSQTENGIPASPASSRLPSRWISGALVLGLFLW